MITPYERLTLRLRMAAARFPNAIGPLLKAFAFLYAALWLATYVTDLIVDGGHRSIGMHLLYFLGVLLEVAPTVLGAIGLAMALDLMMTIHRHMDRASSASG